MSKHAESVASLVERLEKANHAVNGTVLAKIDEPSIAKLVVDLKDAAQWAAHELREAASRLADGTREDLRQALKAVKFPCGNEGGGWDRSLADDEIEAIALALSTPPASPAATTGADLDRIRWTLDNIYTVARRESRRDKDGKSLRPEMWGHILRLCEAAGCRSRTVGVLRED